MYADERAIELLEKPSALGNALAKICKAIQTLPKEGMLVNFSSNLLVSSSVLHRVGILSTHPRLDTRLRRISAPRPSSKHWSSRNTWLAFLLSCLLILSAVAVSLVMADLQVNFTADFAVSQYSKGIPYSFNVASYNLNQNNGTLFYGAITDPFNGNQNTPVFIDQLYMVTHSSNIYVEPGSNGALGVQWVPMGYFVVSSQNSTFASMQAPRFTPEPVWIG